MKILRTIYLTFYLNVKSWLWRCLNHNLDYIESKAYPHSSKVSHKKSARCNFKQNFLSIISLNNSLIITIVRKQEPKFGYVVKNLFYKPKLCFNYSSSYSLPSYYIVITIKCTDQGIWVVWITYGNMQNFAYSEYCQTSKIERSWERLTVFSR